MLDKLKEFLSKGSSGKKLTLEDYSVLVDVNVDYDKDEPNAYNIIKEYVKGKYFYWEDSNSERWYHIKKIKGYIREDINHIDLTFTRISYNDNHCYTKDEVNKYFYPDDYKEEFSVRDVITCLKNLKNTFEKECSEIEYKNSVLNYIQQESQELLDYKAEVLKQGPDDIEETVDKSMIKDV